MKMRAIVVTKAGSPDVLSLREVSKPDPGVDEVLVKVHAATVTRGDVILRKIPRIILLPAGLLFGFKAQKIPGVEFAGVVESKGEKVTGFKEGDEVFGTTTGLSYGANAEYVCVPERGNHGVIAEKPDNLIFEEACAVPVGGMTALYILKQGNISAGHKVLIYGASGSVGTFGIQIARHLGAEVTAVCSATSMEMVKSLGVTKVIDYTKEDFRNINEKYDVIFDAVGKISLSQCKGLLKRNGKFLTVKKPTKESIEDLLFLKQLVEDNQLSPVIDKRFPLEQVAEAHRYVDQGHKKGNVVIIVADADKN